MRKMESLRRNPNMVTRVINGEAILMPVYKTSDEISCIYTLNKAASRIWELIDGKKSAPEIKKTLLEEFDATAEEAENKFQVFLDELRQIKAVQ